MTFAPMLETSDALHARVRAFARGGAPDDFASLGLAIARFQAANSAGFARLVASRGARLERLEDIPGVPAETFRLTRVAVHPPELDVARFETSGTTGDERGVHAFRTTETYEAVALDAGARALVSFGRGPRVVVSLAAAPGETQSSSLGFMLGLFQREWDGRSLADGTFAREHAARWLFGPDGVDLEGLEHAAKVALRRGEPLLVLATAFALVALLDALDGRVLDAPSATAVMVTGGYKGRSREVSKAELRRGVARAFGVPETHVVSEYGMTELTSQLYEGTLPGAALAGPPDVLLEPPTLRVVPVDPVTLAAVPDGEVGMARIIDLGNVDSAVVVQTEDLVRRRDGGIELLGRQPGATARGCSLAVEAWLG
ncbi:MAG TPA: acyl-protein synthetase [Polyangiaceae bacterium]|nr:acyl-protein synthetase [Polyangiaceae bacterium]